MMAGLQLPPCTPPRLSPCSPWSCRHSGLSVRQFIYFYSTLLDRYKLLRAHSHRVGRMSELWRFNSPACRIPSREHAYKTGTWSSITDQWHRDLVTLRITIPSLSSPSEDLITIAFEKVELRNPRLKGTTGRATAFSFTFTASNQVIDDLLRNVHGMCIPHDRTNTNFFL